MVKIAHTVCLFVCLFIYLFIYLFVPMDYCHMLCCCTYGDTDYIQVIM